MLTILDFDDHCEMNNAMPYMIELKELRPDFKATLFSIPGMGSETFWRSHPDWIELAPHGQTHPDSYECLNWSRARMETYLDERETQDWWTQLFKAPGWQINPHIYEALLDRGWAVADQHLEDVRRPTGLDVYFYEDGLDRWHGHVQNVCGNGIRETWHTVCALVEAADGFQFASEATVVWSGLVAV